MVKALITFTFDARCGADDILQAMNGFKAGFARATVVLEAWNVYKVEVDAQDVGDVIEAFEGEAFRSEDFTSITLGWK